MEEGWGGRWEEGGNPCRFISQLKSHLGGNADPSSLESIGSKLHFYSFIFIIILEIDEF